MTRIAPVPNIDIRPDHWDIVRDILQKHVPHYAVWAFGSRAKWTAKQYSDLDLAIITDQPLSLDTSASLADDFSESDLPWKVDIVDWAATSESFRKVIELDKVVVQEVARGLGMANEWVEERFDSLVRFVSEKSQAKDADIDTYVSTENMLADFGGITSASALPLTGSVTKFKVGDTLFSNIRTYFKKVWQAQFDGCCSNDVLVFRPINAEFLLPDYLHQICRWEKFTELSIRTSKGAKMPRGDKDALAQFLFGLPPLEQQRAIAHILGTLDDKIDLNRRINQTLEAMAQAIFKSWFVDFEPVKAKIAAIEQGEDPLRAAMRAISGKTDAELDQMPRDRYDQLAATAALFPDAMEESELGEIPKGWEVKRVGDLIELAYGKALKSTDRKQGSVPVYGSGGVTGYHNEALVSHGAIIVGRKGTVGSLYWEDEPFFPIDTTFYVKPKAVPMTYCFYVMKTLELDKMNTDAAVPGLNRENVYRLELVKSSTSVLNAFDRLVSGIREAMRANENASQSLAELRDTLLPKLLSGKLSVAEMKEQVTL